MTIVFKTKSCKIEKLKDKKFKLYISDGEKFKKFWKYTKKGLKIVKETNTSLIFEAENVLSLKQLLKAKDSLLSYQHCKFLFLDIGKLLEGLEKDHFSNLFIDDDDIVLIKTEPKAKDLREDKPVFDMKFLYLNTEHFLPLKEKKVKINMPFNKNNIYFSPEMKKLKAFPAYIPSNSSYYSLSVLVGNCLLPFKKGVSTSAAYKQHIESILETKLYWALLRCFDERIYLYI
tara:strand:- start:541 stop:1233 length:693 start_codon:yes stop_codon:yes gene_type:complete